MIPARLDAPEPGWTTSADVVIVGGGYIGVLTRTGGGFHLDNDAARARLLEERSRLDNTSSELVSATTIVLRNAFTVAGSSLAAS